MSDNFIGTAPDSPTSLSEAETESMASLLRRINKLNELGIALSSEKDTSRLLENILLGAKELTNADAGTIYSTTEHKTLKFEIVRTDGLNIAMGGTTGKPINFPELPLYRDGQPNLAMVAAYAVLKDQTVNIPDAYTAEGFDFTGTQAFDKNTGYRSTSFLCVPLKNHEEEIIGVLQLINAKDPSREGVIKPFTQEDQQLAESLASQAAIALTNQKLIADLEELFESFIKAIATAIDEKSPYTGGHCHRVPVLAELLGRAASKSTIGELANFHLSDEEMYELKIAAWLHDCGKVVTPTEVVDKATKLEKIFDRIELVDTRFEVLKRDIEIEFLKARFSAVESGNHSKVQELEEEFKKAVEQADADRDFIRESNIGGEFMSEERQNRVREIGQRRWMGPDGEEIDFLTENEVYNLNIARGTINKEERDIINNHVVATIKMLEEIPFPRHLKRVPEMAGGHHETMIGTGYPKGLTREQMSIQARIMAIADVFEALTARDRPYKPGKSLSQSLNILGFMNKDQHIDPDLFRVFIDSKVYMDYAEEYLDPKQIDDVDLSKIPGYVPPESP